MIYCVGHSIISPLGEGTEANIEAVKAGRSGLKHYTERFADVEPFCASLFDTPQEFVPLCIKSVKMAMDNSSINNDQTVFILSTAKGDHLDLYTPAQQIAASFGNRNQPIVVSNACTSGVSAQITAMRLLQSGMYQHAVVVGCDLQSRFIVSGFQAFKALSNEPCTPFDPNRKGLNLGEAAATIIYSRQQNGQQPYWTLKAGSIHNDANHISAPSRTGEGAYLCLKDVLNGVQPEEIALIGVHGTGTLYNDDMERIALQRAGLADIPMSILKPYFGHTMGAAGVLETIICAEMAFRSTLSNGKTRIIKILSGFGGVNAAIRIER
ncbi:MAG: beta-ketoacyl synthase [Paludibacteraceae bacterium]|nr:beta-ketoacyl synthase [Paludibacteraceae bacterium]